MGRGRKEIHCQRRRSQARARQHTKINGKRIKWTVFIQRCSNQWPLKGLYNTASISPIYTHIHTPTQSQPHKATASSSGAVRVRRLAQGHLDTLGQWSSTFLSPRSLTLALVKGKIYRYLEALRKNHSPDCTSNLRPFVWLIVF